MTDMTLAEYNTFLDEEVNPMLIAKLADNVRNYLFKAGLCLDTLSLLVGENSRNFFLEVNTTLGHLHDEIGERYIPENSTLDDIDMNKLLESIQAALSQQ